MLVLRTIFSVAVTAFSVGVAPTQEKKPINKEKLVGNWELVKTTASDKLLTKMKMEFAKDGKFRAWLEGDEKPISESTYEVKGDTIKWKKFKGADNHEETIKSLDEMRLILVQRRESSDGDRMETHEFKKVK